LREHPARGSRKRAFETPTLEITGALLAAAIRPDSEVAEKPQRRRFTAEYKIRILRQADACAEPGAWAALAPKPLRRHPSTLAAPASRRRRPLE
jgi:hypothetical protein